MRRQIILLGVLSIFVMGSFFMKGVCAQEGKTEESLKTQKGLRFTVPEDWPIEKRGGVIAPIPVEEYVLKRFKEIEDKLAIITQTLSAYKEDSQRALKEIKGEETSQFQEIKAAIESINSDISRLKESLNNLKGLGGPDSTSDLGAQLNAVNQNLSNKFSTLKSRVDQLENSRLRDFQFNLEVLEQRVNILEEQSGQKK